MNKDQAINILLEHAQKYNDTNYKVDIQNLTAAVLIIEMYLKKNKKDNKIDITGLQFNLMKGV
tara:strand:+ start:393 stop:581 length:189 start_codon:yes stop_codon:yes gene_type:complete